MFIGINTLMPAPFARATVRKTLNQLAFEKTHAGYQAMHGLKLKNRVFEAETSEAKAPEAPLVDRGAKPPTRQGAFPRHRRD